MKNKILKISLISAIFSAFFAKQALAVCPVCTVAVIGGLGLSRWFGIDDSITGLWIGGLTVSLILWTINWFDRKNYHFKFREVITVAGYYILIVVPLFFTGVFGLTYNKLWGIDKLFLGIILGSLFFYGATFLYERMKKRNGGRAHFPFEKIAMPVGALVLVNIILYFLTKVY